MKLPNGYGNISKLPGNRRTPFRVRKTVGWKWYDRLEGCFLDDAPPEDEALQVLDDGKLRFQSKQQYVTVGYYETRQKALQALAAYNEDPYDLHFDTITFAEVYERWSEKHFEGISDSNVKGYKAAFNVCQPIHNMKLVDIKVDHLQQVVDDSGKNSPTLKKVKILFGMIYDYAVMHEIVGKEKRDMVKYVDISKAGNPNSYNRKPFSDGEIDLIPLHIQPPDPALGFGHEQVWKITMHNEHHEIGQISYRTGESRCVFYYGHIGYHIDPPYRGNHYAMKACVMLKNEIRRSGKCSVIITCDPDNLPSRKTCQRLGCMFECVTQVPEDLQKKYDISDKKCRYIWHVGL